MPEVLPSALIGRSRGRIRPQVAALEAALATVGNPQQHFRSILVVGTNGKGSTVAMLEAMLAGHGLKTGLYTSPHLVRVEERIRIGGTEVSRPQLDRALSALDHGRDLTFFELLTGAAFVLFAEAGVDCAVLEAGMGGRWDATRLAASTVAGLTNVGTDHRHWLGDGREAIAADKGAALAAAERAVLGPQVDAAIRPHLRALHAVPAHEIVRLAPAGPGRVDASWDDGRAELEVPLEGRHQHHNLHLALALGLAARDAGLLDRVDPLLLPGALARVRWPARLSHHVVQGREVLVDGAHNLEGVEVLASYLAETGRRCNLLFSCLDDKPVKAMATLLRPHVAKVAICALDDERAMPLDRLRDAFPDAVVAADPLAALAGLPDPVLVAGSLRLAGAMLALAGS